MELHYLENLLKECPTTLIFTSIFLVLSIIFFKLKNWNLPPGPSGVPVLGYWPFLSKKTAHLDFEALKNKYGEVFSFKIVGQLYIHLGSIKAIREAHVTKSDCFAERTGGFSVLTCFFEDGILGSYGEQWKTLRKFFVQKFREFGLSSGKDTSGTISDAVQRTIASIRSSNGSPIDIMSIFNVQLSTIIRRVFFNDDCVTHEELLEFVETYERVVDVFFTKNVLCAGKISKYLILPFDKDFQNAAQCYKKVYKILNTIIKRHKDTFDEQSIRNIIDSYYKEKNERARKNDPTANYFTDKALSSSMIQFVGDGILGVAAFASYFIQALIEHPEDQEKIFKELEEVIGPNNQPSLEDKSRLPYTNAFILEVTRTSDFFTYFPSLECTKETTIGGYRVPKGAVTLMDFWTSHRDPNVYDEPNTFNPSRFLKQAGKDKAESPVTFGVGKRSCVGEAYVSSQTFLLLTSLIKHFRIEVPKGSSNISYLDGRVNIIAHPR